MKNPTLEEFIKFITAHKTGNKSSLISKITAEFNFILDRKVYYCNTFAVRFSSSKTNSFSNTVLSLSNLQKYDHIPFLVCLVTPQENKIFLANSTFLKKISHSSQELRANNIKGSFNGSDILREFNGLQNNANNITKLFAYHCEIGFEGNLERLVESTNNIDPTGTKFVVDKNTEQLIFKSIERADNFSKTKDYNTLKSELDSKLEKYKDLILVASHIENVNIRGRIIEYLIAGEDEELKKKLTEEITTEYSQMPYYQTKNTLGDYLKDFENYNTATDIKTKIMLLNSNPKAYNIDKFLEFMSRDKSVLMFYFIGIDSTKIVNKTLVSVYQEDLINSTITQQHWAGRNSRGVAQFEGKTIHKLIENPNHNTINQQTAKAFIEKMIKL
ncbi:MAG: hypothetical protein LBQ28_00170 [Prevotellaceae bacterium]|jgi:tetratricopeptide (TPR) repeat protein|nr:hypothetical protein [Prevotellaceae bacterium]